MDFLTIHADTELYSDAFSKREQASENKFIREKEMERLVMHNRH